MIVLRSGQYVSSKFEITSQENSMMKPTKVFPKPINKKLYYFQNLDFYVLTIFFCNFRLVTMENIQFKFNDQKQIQRLHFIF